MSGPSGLLLDTPVLAEVRSDSPDPAVVGFLRSRSHLRIFVSALTLGELESFAPGWLRELSTRFAANILPVDHEVALLRRTLPEPAPGDARGALRTWLAATAIAHDLNVVTGEPEAFVAYGASAVSPFMEFG
ncbi:MAG: PIN domain-containing protein [Arthrobacter sp.]